MTRLQPISRQRSVQTAWLAGRAGLNIHGRHGINPNRLGMVFIKTGFVPSAENFSSGAPEMLRMENSCRKTDNPASKPRLDPKAMSKDKHKGVARRKFALANLPISDCGKRKVIRGYLGEPTPRKNGARREYVDITADLKMLEKEGLVKRRRSQPVGGFNRHIRRTRLVANTEGDL